MKKKQIHYGPDDLKPMDRDNCLEKPEYKPRPQRFNQGDCVKCDGYDMTCSSYRAYHETIVSPCTTKWNMGGLERTLER